MLEEYGLFEGGPFNEPGEATPSINDIELDSDGSRDPFLGGAAVPGQFNVRPLPLGGALGPARAPGRPTSPGGAARNIPQTQPGGAPYTTIDVQATPVPSNPVPLRPLGTPGGAPIDLPSREPRGLNLPRAFDALPQPGTPGGIAGELPAGLPQPTEAGLTGADEQNFGEEPLEPLGEEGTEYAVYAGWRIETYNFTTGQLLSVQDEPYDLIGVGYGGPIVPQVEITTPGVPAGQRVVIGFDHQEGGQTVRLNFRAGGGSNTDLQLISFDIGVNPVAGQPAFPRPRRERGRGPQVVPIGFGTPPASSPPALPAPPPSTPEVSEEPRSAPTQSPANEPSPVPGPDPSPESAPEGSPPATPPAPPQFPSAAPESAPNTPPPTPPGPDSRECIELRGCLTPTFRSILVDELRSQIIDRFLDRILEGSCSLPEICDKVDTIIGLLTQEDRIQLERILCNGTKLTVIRPGRRIENIIPAIRTAAGFLQDLIEERVPCRRYEESSILSTGTTTRGNEVSYVSIPNEVVEVELIIPGPLPSSLRLYRISSGGEEQAKYGAIQYAYVSNGPGFSVGSPQAWVWTRGTVIEIPPFAGRSRFVRVFLEPGLGWQLWDTGLRLV